MNDESPDTGSTLMNLAFAAGAAVVFGVVLTGFHAVEELLRRKDRKEERER